MKRLLVATVVLLALATPATADAYNTNIQKFGVGTRVDQGDLLNLTTAETFSWPGPNHWHVRAAVDCGRGLPQNVYGSKWWDIYSTGGTIMPILTWKVNGQQHTPNNQAEEDSLQACAQSLVVMDRYVTSGIPNATPANAYEIYNEPNCASGDDDPGTMSPSTYHHDIFEPARAGIRAAASDTNVVVGGLAFGTQGSNSCTDAATWTNAYIVNGWNVGSSNQVNGIAVHAYGYTNPSTWVREATTAQTCAKAREEYLRVKAWAAGKDVLVTEMGRRAGTRVDDPFNQSQQLGYLDCMDDASTGVGGSKLISNWPADEGTPPPNNGAEDRIRSAIAWAPGYGKTAWSMWSTHPSGGIGWMTP